MAVTETVIRRSGSLKLANGDNAALTVSMGTLDKNQWDAQKFMNIASALSPIMEKSITQALMTPVYELEV